MSGAPFDPYRVLGLPPGATRAEIERAYRRLAKQLHPDLHGADAGADMQELNRAVRILADPDRRRAWDGAQRAEREAAVEQMAGHGRVRAASAWPRVADPPSPTGGVRDSAWLAVAVALVVIAGALALGWVASTSDFAATARDAIGRAGVTPVSGFSLDADHEIGVFRPAPGTIGLVVAERGESGWLAHVVSQVTGSHPLSVLLFVDEAGPDGLPSIAFGRAEGGVTAVRIGGATGGETSVANGTWSIAVPGVTDPSQLTWQFVLADGTVLSGAGELRD
jgi:hypothetical protein